MKSSKLLEYKRANITEREYFGFICVVNSSGNTIYSQGEAEENFFLLRSAQKPFQALPLIKSRAKEQYGLKPCHVAIASGSHAGSAAHIKVIKEILDKSGVDEKSLKCGAHMPLDFEERKRLIKNDASPSFLHNNCSGKHSSMLAVCKHNQWDLDTYLDKNHPLQKDIIKITKELCEFTKEVPIALDGCNAPVIGLPIKNIALGFINLFSSQEGKYIIDSCLDNYYLFGGNKRFDSEIIQISNSRLFAKVGAEGLCVVLNTDKNECLVVKITDGNNDARALVIVECLKKLNWIETNEYENLSQLYPKKIFTHNNVEAGEVKFFF